MASSHQELLEQLDRAQKSLDPQLKLLRNATAALQQATKAAKVPLVYVRSLGNRDNRPTPSSKQLAEMGYKACIDALLYLLVSFHHAKRALMELKQNGEYGGLSQEDCGAARHEIETLVGLDRFYEVEEQTVEEKKWGDR